MACKGSKFLPRFDLKYDTHILATFQPQKITNALVMNIAGSFRRRNMAGNMN